MTEPQPKRTKTDGVKRERCMDVALQHEADQRAIVRQAVEATFIAQPRLR